MKVGIIGSGVVGQTLGKGFASKGYEVMIGTRDASKLESLEDIRAGEPKEAAIFGELIVLAVKGKNALDALELAGEENLRGKIVIDVTNPIADSPPNNGVLSFFTSLDKSLMEELQEAYPSAKFVKAFNSVGSAFMVDPDFGGVKPTMFICGNDDSAKREVEKIVEKFGFEVSDMGKAEAARAIEPLCILWCIPGFLRNEWSHAFKLLKK